MNSLKKIFLSLVMLLPLLSVQASNLDYIKKIDSKLQNQLIEKGDALIKAIYAGGDLSKIIVFDIIASDPTVKKGILGKLKNMNITLATKKSNADETQKAERREYLAKILAIIWKIHDLGEKQGVKGSSVSYKVVDGGEKVYKFLKNYVDLAKAHSNSFAYDRNPKKKLSSHYREESPESQFGVDMRFYANQSSLTLLPHNKKHLLFGKLDFDGSAHPPLLFIKFEEYGIAALSEKFGHGINYLKSLSHSKDALASKRIERVILPAIIEAYLTIFSKVALELSHKLFLETPKTVKGMIDALEALSKEKAEFQIYKQNFINVLKKEYPLDGEYIRWRSGNEVIIKLP